jgi:hypothetical protein
MSGIRIRKICFLLYLQGVRPINQLISGLDGSAKNAKSRQLTLQGEETDVHLVPPKYFFTFLFPWPEYKADELFNEQLSLAIFPVPLRSEREILKGHCQEIFLT